MLLIVWFIKINLNLKIIREYKINFPNYLLGKGELSKFRQYYRKRFREVYDDVLHSLSLSPTLCYKYCNVKNPDLHIHCFLSVWQIGKGGKFFRGIIINYYESELTSLWAAPVSCPSEDQTAVSELGGEEGVGSRQCDGGSGKVR